MQFARQHYGGKFFATGQNDSSAHIPYKPKDPFICLCKLVHTLPLQLRDIHQHNSSLSIFVAWTLGQNTAPGFQLQHVRPPKKGTASSLMPSQHKSISKDKMVRGMDSMIFNIHFYAARHLQSDSIYGANVWLMDHPGKIWLEHLHLHSFI